MPANTMFCTDEPPRTMHGGVITSLLDTVFGLVNMCCLNNVENLATLDLRVDYFGKVRPRRKVFVRARCDHYADGIAFNSGEVWVDELRNQIAATGKATFAIKEKTQKVQSNE